MNSENPMGHCQEGLIMKNGNGTVNLRNNQSVREKQSMQ